MPNLMEEQIKKEIAEHQEVMEKLTSYQAKKIELIALALVNSYRNNGKMVLFGNGGSAADAQHIAAEMMGRFKVERKSLPAIALTPNSSIVTAIGNDYGFEYIFERQVDALVNAQDVVIGISTSGNAENVLKGLKKAKEKGATTIAFTGRTGGKLQEIAHAIDIFLQVPSDNTPRIQEAHIAVGHIVCGLVEKELFDTSKLQAP